MPLLTLENACLAFGHVALLDHAARLEGHLGGEIAAALEDVLGALDAEVAVLQQRRVQGLGEHAKAGTDFKNPGFRAAPGCGDRLLHDITAQEKILRKMFFRTKVVATSEEFERATIPRIIVV